MKKLAIALVLFLGTNLVVAQVSQEVKLAERYYEDGEFESALDLYLKLNRRGINEDYIKKIASCYENLNQYDEAIKFLTKTSKKSDRPIFPVLKASILEKTGDLKGADKIYEEVINKKLRNDGDFIQIGSFLYQAGKLEWALQTYLKARRKGRDEYAFANEIANIYAQQGEFGKATTEYLNLYFQDKRGNYNTSNLSILNMASPSNQDEIETALLRAVDREPSEKGLRNILYEFYVLTENFMEAFIQVKSIDKLYREDGLRVFQFGETMRNNKNYDLSDKAFDYIIQKLKDNSQFFFQAHFQKAINAELKAFDNIPVDLESIQAAVEAYEDLLKEFGRKPAFYEPIYRMSKLMVFYLDQLDGAKQELELLTASRQSLTDENWAEARILLGDIHLIQQEFNKAKLIFTEVSDLFQDRQLGALAKYKLAQLAYYKGEFNLSQALLSAIKDNTSNDISNDAIKLNLTILDNTGLDTTTTALEMFATAQLLTYQRKYDSSLNMLDSLALKFSDHPLADEILWEKATIFLKQNDLDRAMGYIDRILELFPYDIYGDDALYTKARIYDFTLKDKDQAMKYYLQFLSTYPGSLFSVEVRKRIRKLREG
ncbi:MAG: tetratricopeptide repeat protein [Bacteroidia bacterium]|nr:tetratricopeptide repeat protein [Bacteroidia bacterium]